MPLLLYLLFTGGLELQKADRGHKDEEHHGLRLADAAVVAAAGVEGAVNVQSEHFRRLYNAAVRLLQERPPPRQREVLVEELEAVREREEDADRKGAHHVRNGDLPERLPVVGAVNAGRLIDLLVDFLQVLLLVHIVFHRLLRHLFHL